MFKKEIIKMIKEIKKRDVKQLLDGGVHGKHFHIKINKQIVRKVNMMNIIQFDSLLML